MAAPHIRSQTPEVPRWGPSDRVQSCSKQRGCCHMASVPLFSDAYITRGSDGAVCKEKAKRGTTPPKEEDMGAVASEEWEVRREWQAPNMHKHLPPFSHHRLRIKPAVSVEHRITSWQLPLSHRHPAHLASAATSLCTTWGNSYVLDSICGGTMAGKMGADQHPPTRNNGTQREQEAVTRQRNTIFNYCWFYNDTADFVFF